MLLSLSKKLTQGHKHLERQERGLVPRFHAVLAKEACDLSGDMDPCSSLEIGYKYS